MIKNPLVSVPITFGLIGSGLFITMFLVTYYIEKNPLIDLQLFDFILIPIFLFMAMKQYRDYMNDKILHFWQGMTIGFITFIVIGLLSGFFVYIMLTLIDPEILTAYIVHTSNLFVAKREEFIQQFGKQLYKDSVETNLQTTAMKMGIDDFLKKAGIGFMLTIPIAVILRRRKF